jgi:hypothetical protein
MRGKPYRIAIITIDSVKRRSFGWLATGGKPFAQFDPADIDDDLLTSVFNLYRHVYSKIDPNLFIRDKFALLKYTRWVILIDDEKNIAGFLLCREHDYGIKLGLTAAADSKKAKEAVVDLNRKAFNVAGVFGEVSPPLEKKLKGHVPELKASVAAKVMQPLKRITRVDKDRKHYWREIKNIGEQRKMMVGRPLI